MDVRSIAPSRVQRSRAWPVKNRVRCCAFVAVVAVSLRAPRGLDNEEGNTDGKECTAANGQSVAARQENSDNEKVSIVGQRKTNDYEIHVNGKGIINA